MNPFGTTARNIIRNCGIEYSLEVADNVLESGKSINVEWYADLLLYVRRRVNSQIAQAIKNELSAIS